MAVPSGSPSRGRLGDRRPRKYVATRISRWTGLSARSASATVIAATPGRSVRLGERGEVPVVRLRRTGPVAAVLVDDDPPGHGDEPGPQRALPRVAEPVRVAPGPQQRLLDDVLRALPVPRGEPQHERQQRAGVLGVQPSAARPRGRCRRGAPRRPATGTPRVGPLGAVRARPGLTTGRPSVSHADIMVDTPGSRYGRERRHTWCTDSCRVRFTHPRPPLRAARLWTTGARRPPAGTAGGVCSITQAMARACREAGVDIVLNTPVEEVIVANGRAAGVVAGGKGWRSKSVISGVNPKLLFDRLVPQGAVDRDVASRMHGWKCESATFRMNVALSELPKFTVLPKKGNHLTAGIIMAPSLDYMHRAWLDAAVNGWTRQPIVEMLIPSTLDSTLAPKGKHVASLFCQHFRYDLGPERSWDKEREQAADAIIAMVDGHAPGFAKSVIGRQIHSPLDLERRFGLIGGDIFHGKMSLDQLFSARPMIGAADYRMPLKGLYLCGSGAHPGGGVTGAPGHNAAHAVLADRRFWKRRH